eukprot:gene12608-10259_t
MIKFGFSKAGSPPAAKVARRCAVLLVAVVVLAGNPAGADVKPSVRTQEGNLLLSGKDVLIQTGQAASVSIQEIADRVNTVVQDLVDVEAAIAGTIDSKIAAAATVAEVRTDGEIAAMRSELESERKDKIDALESDLAATQAALADKQEELAAAVSEMNAELGVLKASSGKPRWVGHHTFEPCLAAGQVQTTLVVAGHGFVPNVVYTLRLDIPEPVDESRVIVTKAVAKLNTDLSEMSTLTFNYDLLVTGWGTSAGGADPRMSVLDEKGKFVPYGGKDQGDIVLLRWRDTRKPVESCSQACSLGSKSNPGANCKAILAKCPEAPSGNYYLTLSGRNTDGLIAKCDMETEEAGWNEVLFRFATYENKDSRTGNSAALTYLLFRRSESNNNNFPTMLQQGHRNKGDPGGVKVCGWYKATKDRTNGARTSSSDHCINLLHWNNGGTISERHQGSSGGSDQWIDLWDSVDGSGNDYDKHVGGGNSRGMKCIAGVCHTTQPINLYYR